MANTNKGLSTDSYKGVRDFYPEDMAIQRYIFDIWSQTAESFGYERYDASILEPSALYKSKGAENEEMVNEQTYTFIDRGNREVTLRPEMTPTVARMVAGRRRELTFPVRWYSIPNLFRYERPQKGRLREHYQLNCDMFGVDHFSSDVEIIALAYHMLLNFGADAKMFEIRINNRKEMTALYESVGVTDADTQAKITRLNDKFRKIKKDEYKNALMEIVNDKEVVKKIYAIVSDTHAPADNEVLNGLMALDIKNVVVDRSLARGFDYYTGTIFEIFDVSGENNRSMLGGGRYDNLTGLFGGDPIVGIGFGMGDVTMRDFLETHGLLTSDMTAPTLMILPTDEQYNMEAQKIAQQFRAAEISVAVDLSSKKVGKKISDAADAFVSYALVLGEDEIKSKKYTIKNLEEKAELSGTIAELITKIAN
jgi:histidyl-tRNA synthetase